MLHIHNSNNEFHFKTTWYVCELELVQVVGFFRQKQSKNPQNILIPMVLVLILPGSELKKVITVNYHR